MNNTIKNVLPRAVELFCAKHLIANAIEGYGKGVKKLVWACVFPINPESYSKAIDALAALSKDCADYINQIPNKRWATYAVPALRYGMVTSQTPECCNHALLPARALPALQCLKWTWNYTMCNHANRTIAAAIAEGDLTPLPASKFAAVHPLPMQY